MSEMFEYKCPCCGGAMGFDSDVQKMKCPFCDTEFEMEALQAQELSKNADAPDEINWNNADSAEWDDENMRAYICNSCGGEIVADENTAATSCPFCNNAVTMTGRLSGVLRPDLVIPFKLDKKDAKEGLLKHYKGKKFLPDVFADKNHIEEIKGIYVPFWLFNADSEGAFVFDATTVRSWSDSDYYYTETSYYQVFRNGCASFENIPVDGSQKMADDLMQSIEPYDLSEAVDFQSAYLAGYLADRYDVTAEDSTGNVNMRIKSSMESVFRSTVMGYNSVIAKSGSVKTQNVASKYALLPVWILNTTYNGERYMFAMNGQTGKFVGDLPVDKKKVWKRWAITTAVIEAVIAALILIIFS